MTRLKPPRRPPVDMRRRNKSVLYIAVALIAAVAVAAALAMELGEPDSSAQLDLDTDGDGAADVIERGLGLNPEVEDRIAYVDARSIGGPCSDRRPVSVVRRPDTPWCSFEPALAAGGANVLVRGGDYGVATISGSRASPVRINAYPGEAAVLRSVVIESGLVRLRGFRIRGTVNVGGEARRVDLLKNRIVTSARGAGPNVNIQAGARSLRIEGNVLAQRGGTRGVSGINFSSTDTKPPIVRVTIRGNRIGPIRGGGDAIQAKHTRDLLIEENEIFEIARPPGGSEFHPDVFQSIYGFDGLTLRRNFIHDIAAQGVTLQTFRGVNRDFRASDNVIARVAYPWTAFGVEANGARVVHNTIGGLLLVGKNTRRTTLVGNISSSLLIQPGAGVSREERNLATRFTRRRGRGSILGGARFRNPARNDFRLRNDSRGRGRGVGGADLGSRFADFSK
jgi:hypothetical protein